MWQLSAMAIGMSWVNGGDKVNHEKQGRDAQDQGRDIHSHRTRGVRPLWSTTTTRPWLNLHRELAQQKQQWLAKYNDTMWENLCFSSLTHLPFWEFYWDQSSHLRCLWLILGLSSINLILWGTKNRKPKRGMTRKQKWIQFQKHGWMFT